MTAESERAAASSRSTPAAVLFDLDGTLIDSAPDLAGAANEMRAARGLEPLPYESLRPTVGSGARGMVGQAFDVGADDPAFPALRDEFLTRYQTRMTRDTRVYDGVEALLAGLRARGIAWGIVTNKIARFAGPVCAALGLAPAREALVCGDTTAHAKPHPDPLLEAAGRLGVSPADCVYVGDDLRDVQAARAAGMGAIVAGWGYLGLGVGLGEGLGEGVEAWGADAIAADVPALARMLLQTRPMP